MVSDLAVCLSEIFRPEHFGQFADDQVVRLFDPVSHQRCGQSLILYVAPMLLVPMEGWRHRLILQAQRLVSLGRQFAGKAWPALPVLSLFTQPKAQEDFAFHAEGDIVLAKRLVFGHAWQRKRIAPYFFYIHLLSDSFAL